MRDPNKPNHFEAFKARVLNRIAKQHEQAAEFIRDDMDVSDAALVWGIRIADHEVALFQRFILLPTSDASLFAQWCWSLAASKQGKPILLIGQRPLPEDPNLDSPRPTMSREHSSLSQRERLDGFFQFCDMDNVVLLCGHPNTPEPTLCSILTNLQDNVPIHAAYLQGRTA
ncbi:hypothetical protein PSTG_01535 [Puccinia striiformis f. sp. tritici PST-78]|uniref:Uncharacterized protein n=1 Tax=Puccinia striiformis f. sp. tritici PST-78 TaxID=1165861 RepID=A0A0L0W1D1_9BASI|nr:hypothetical protein PSTG_01535 [Puccinia striiformis f. sp. tritici PST-78]